MRAPRLSLALAIAAAWGSAVVAPASAQSPEAPPPDLAPCGLDYCVGDEVVIPGGPGSPGGGGSGGGGGGGGPVCHSMPFNAAVGRGDYGADLPNDPGPRPSLDAVLMYTQCEGETTGRVWWWTPGEPAAPQPMTPAVLGSIARARLEGSLPEPDVTSSPAAGVAAIVGFPSFVSVDSWTGTVTDEACDPQVPSFCVGVTAVPSLSWTPGEPGAGPVACAGAGTIFDPAAGTPEEQAAVEGACAHAFRLRTGVDGRPPAWPGVVTVTWQLTYTSPGGDGSLDDVVKSAALPRTVDEVQTVVESAG